MEITKNTYIDTLQQLKMVSSSTRNKCVDIGIFTIKDLEQHLDYRGRIALRGFSDRSIIELQSAWDKACGSSTVSSSSNKPRRLTRILSQEEKSTITELEELFESTYLSGVTKTPKEDSLALIDDCISDKVDLEVLLRPTTFAIEHVKDVYSFLDAFNLYLNFLENERRKPNIFASGEEYQLANWYHYILTNQEALDANFDSLIDSLKNCADSIDPHNYLLK